MLTQQDRYHGVRGRLAQQNITLSFVHDDRAMVREEQEQAWERAAVEAGTPGRWAGIGLEGTAWSNGRLTNVTFKRDVQLCYVRFPHGAGVGRAVADAFAAEGFGVEWSGDEMGSVCVHLI